jgi:uncharacterized membrane protein YhiD involved in acid resistance
LFDSLDFSIQGSNLEQPSIWSATYVLLMAFGLSTCIAIVYHLTSGRRNGLGQFIQTLILGSIGAAIIVLAIGDSVGRGLGILGALAIIRFRTTLRQQRDIVFVFCSLGIGMACGMYGFNIAIIGTLLLCILAISFRFTSLHGLPMHRYQLKVIQPWTVNHQQAIEKVIASHQLGFRLIRTDWSEEKNGICEFTYLLLAKPRADDLIRDLKSIDSQVQVRVWSRMDNEIE